MLRRLRDSRCGLVQTAKTQRYDVPMHDNDAARGCEADLVWMKIEHQTGKHELCDGQSPCASGIRCELDMKRTPHRGRAARALQWLWALCTTVALAVAAHAQSAQCGFIRDADQQAQCRASSGGGSGQCGFIRDADLQAFCRATTGSGSAQCGFIRNSDQQAMCRALTGTGSGQCGFIRDPDRQAYCRALTGAGSGQCGFIRNGDLQAMCRASTGGGRGQCGFIQDTDLQAMCRASF
jgi:hypothetical protein